MSTLRTMILLAFTVGLPAWAILSAPTHSPKSDPSEPALVARPAISTPDRLPTASITAIEPTDNDSQAAHANNSAPLAKDDRFSAIQNRLKQLGSSYLLLETQGRGDVQYRFHCELSPLGDESNAQRFEATGHDPIAAMETVLQQAEAWTLDRSRLAGRDLLPRR